MAGEDRELTIRIKGTLTPEAFAQAREELKKLGLETDTVKSKGKGLEDQFKKTSDGAGLLNSTVGKLTAAFSAARIIDGLISGLGNFARNAVATASHIVDLSDKLGISTEFIQKFDYVGRQAGVTVDNFGDSAFKLSVNIAKGGASIDNALRELGLTRDMLKSLKPEEQIDLVLRKLGGLTDVQERNRLGVELMGKSYSGVAAAVGAYAQSVDKARVVSDAQVRAVDDAGDAFDRLVDRVEKGVIKQFGNLELGLEGLNKGWSVVLPVLKQVALGHSEAAASIAIAASVTDRLKEANDKKAESDRQALAAQASGQQTLTDYTAVLRAAQKEIDGLSAKDKGAIESGLKLGATIDELADQFHLSSSAARIFISYQQDVAAASKAAAEAAKKQAEEEGKASDARRKAVEEFREKTVIWAGSSAAENMVLAGGQNLKDALVKPYESLTDVLKSSTSALDELIKRGPNLKEALVAPVDQWKKFNEQLDGFAQSLTRLAQVTGGTFSGGVKDIAEIVTAWDMAAKAAENYAKATSAAGRALALVQGATAVAAATQGGGAKGIAGGALSGAEMGAMFGPWGAAVGGIAGALVGAVRGHGNETKTDREALAKQLGFGDLGGLYADLEKLGEQGQKLADVGMHVVGKHDQAANEAWMKEVSAFYDDLHAKQGRILDDLGGLEEQIGSLGAIVPDDLDGIVKQLVKIGDTKNAQQGIDDLRGAFTKYSDVVAKTEAFKTIEQEMKDVGLTADDMNASFRQAADEETARTIAKQWKDLAPYVNDAGVLAGKFGDKLEQLVKDSLDYGVAIPESMRPILESLLKQGKLTDDNGTKLTDLSQLNFEEDPLQKSFDELNLTMQDIRDILRNDLPHAFDTVGDHGEDAARRAKRAFDDLPTDIDINVRPHMQGMAHLPGADFGDNGVPVLDAPVRPVTRPGYAWLNPGDIAGMPSLGGLGASVNLTVNVNGANDPKRVAEEVIAIVNTALGQRRIQVPRGNIVATTPHM